MKSKRTYGARPKSAPRKTESLNRFLRPREVCERLGISRTQVWRWQRDGLFPPFIEIGPRARGLFEAVFIEWMEARPIVGSEEVAK